VFGVPRIDLVVRDLEEAVGNGAILEVQDRRADGVVAQFREDVDPENVVEVTEEDADGLVKPGRI